MPAFGCNAITAAFARRILYEPVKGFRLTDRVVSAIDRFVGALTRFMVPTDGPGVFNRWLFIYPFVGAQDWTHALNLADAPNSGYQGGGGVNSPTYAPTGKFERFRLTWSGNPVHNTNGVTMVSGSSGNTNCDMADATNCYNAWNRKSHGVYSRTNSAFAGYDFSASFVEPRNGYTYTQGTYCRYTDGNCYGDLVYWYKSGVSTQPNRNTAAVSDSLGLYSDNTRGPYYGNQHYMYKRGTYISGDQTPEAGMGYGTGPVTVLTLNATGRNYAFFFSTRHTRTLEGPLNTDGTGGQLPGFNADFNYFVEQLQVALARNV